MNKSQTTILSILSVADREMYALEIIECSEGALKRGTVYVWLSRLENDGLVASRDGELTPGGLHRRLYKITPNGRRAMEPKESSFRQWEKIIKGIKL